MPLVKISALLTLLLISPGSVSAHEADIVRQPLVPIMQIDHECPLGFFGSAGYCIPATKATPAVIPTYSGTRATGCPSGYRNNNGYCQIFTSAPSYSIPMLTGLCPRGYLVNQGFCIIHH